MGRFSHPVRKGDYLGYNRFGRALIIFAELFFVLIIAVLHIIFWPLVIRNATSSNPDTPIAGLFFFAVIVFLITWAVRRQARNIPWTFANY